MTFVKICGISNLEDAEGAVSVGADALGFNFYESSPRYIEPLSARRIIDELPTSILKVGVFVNVSTPFEVDKIATESGVDALQLHGSESPEFCNALKGWFVIKVLGVGNDFELSDIGRYDTDAIMLDARDTRLHGGTGRVIDWEVALRAREFTPKLFLAGGLSPENVVDAIKIVGPYAVDACSCLEERPGKKNLAKVEEFVKAVRSVKP